MTDTVTQTKSVKAEIEKASNGAFILSSTGLDRDGDMVTADAMSKAIKGKSKILALWQHKTDQPVGFWDNLRVEKDRLIGDLQLAKTNLGLMVKELLDFGTPLGASIGFMGKGSYNEDRGGIDWTDIELLETSVVSVPANPEAMQIAKNFGYDAKSLGVDLDVAASGLKTVSKDTITKAQSAVERADKIMRQRP